MQQSGDPETRQLGSELQIQLVTAGQTGHGQQAL
jgi:hypothetical protein